MMRVLWVVIALGCAKPSPVDRTTSLGEPRRDAGGAATADLNACTADDDCEISVYQEGCCTSACIGYPTTKLALAARKAKEQCPAEPMECPPPAPCPVYNYRVIGARCSEGHCEQVRGKLPPQPPTPNTIVEEEGEGSCKADSDCELSNWQVGCTCHGTCGSYAISRRALAARVKKENCPKVRKTPCTSPSRCPDPKSRALEAKCRAGKCTTVSEVLPPPGPDPDSM